VLSRYARVYQWAERVPASVAAKLAGVRADSSIFYYLDGVNTLYFFIHCGDHHHQLSSDIYDVTKMKKK